MTTTTDTDATYNGHPTWDHWNASLWISNDEGLYRTALDVARSVDASQRGDYLADMLCEYNDGDYWITPDGCIMTPELCEYALACLLED